MTIGTDPRTRLSGVRVRSARDNNIDYEVIQRFCSRDRAIAIAKQWDNGWFPLFEANGIAFWLIGVGDHRRTAPIFSNDDLDLPDEPRFENLTEMMHKIVFGVKEALSGR